MLLGISLLIGPVIIYLFYQSVWLLLPFLLIPLGIFTVRGIYRAAKTLIWRERHLSEYILSKDQIQFIDWQEQHPLTPEKGSIPISSIDKVIFSGYIVREMVAYKSGGEKITETAPILYVIYNEGQEIQKLLSIRFYEKSDGLNDWLRFFQNNDIPLCYSGAILYRNDRIVMDNETRLRVLKDDKDLLPFQFVGDWNEQIDLLIPEWNRMIEARYANQPDHKEKDNNLPIKNWVLLLLRVYPVFIALSYVLARFAGKGIISDESFLPGFVLMFLTAVLYFYLLHTHLKWYHMIRFSIECLVISILTGVIFGEQSAAAEEMLSTIAGVTMVFPIMVWIPFLAVKLLRRNK